MRGWDTIQKTNIPYEANLNMSCIIFVNLLVVHFFDIVCVYHFFGVHFFDIVFFSFFKGLQASGGISFFVS